MAKSSKDKQTYKTALTAIKTLPEQIKETYLKVDTSLAEQSLIYDIYNEEKRN